MGLSIPLDDFAEENGDEEPTKASKPVLRFDPADGEEVEAVVGGVALVVAEPLVGVCEEDAADHGDGDLDEDPKRLGPLTEAKGEAAEAYARKPPPL